MAASTFNTNEIYAKELEEELMKYTRRDDQNKAQLRSVEKFQEVKRKLEEVQSSKEPEVNITECTKYVHCEPDAPKYQEDTESSSSFDDSDSCLENDAPLSDTDAWLGFHGDSVIPQNVDTIHEKFRLRKKKPTEHWRSHVQPLIWRCKWLELQIKKLESHAQAYDKELETYKKKKQTLPEGFVSIDGIRSVSFSQRDGKGIILKRKKRRRVEEAKDMSEYMLQHKLFSYYENKKSLTDGVPKRIDLRNPPGKATQTADINIEFDEEDELLSTNYDADNSDEHMLWKIFSLQSQVGILKSKLDRITSQNVGIFACLDEFSLSIPSSSSNPNAGDGTEHTVDFVMPENSISSHGDTVHDDVVSTGRARFSGAPNKVGDTAEVKEEVDNLISNDGPASIEAKEPEPPMDSRRSCRVRFITASSSSRRKRGRRKPVGSKSRKSSG